jgi:hypothetical protein
MKVSKGQGLLYIFDVLISKRCLKKNDIIDELQITELTFWRYIQEIKAFIYNFNLPYELVYDRSKDVYDLIENWLSNTYFKHFLRALAIRLVLF